MRSMLIAVEARGNHRWAFGLMAALSLIATVLQRLS